MTSADKIKAFAQEFLDARARAIDDKQSDGAMFSNQMQWTRKAMIECPALAEMLKECVDELALMSWGDGRSSQEKLLRKLAARIDNTK